MGIYIQMQLLDLEIQGDLGGNTDTPLDHDVQVNQVNKKDKKKSVQGSQIYNWTFTLPAKDPIDPEEPEVIADILRDKCKKFTFQLERAPKTGYLHYQGCLSLIQKERLTTVKNILGDKAHLEPCKNMPASIKYCSKIDTRVDGPWDQLSEFIEIPPLTHLWQLQLRDSLLKRPNYRDIHWIWEDQGNAGKSVFCKHMALKYGALVVTSGSSKDVAFMIKKSTKIILFDFPRTQMERVNYGLIECLKNGCITSAKYETSTKIFNNPHIVCFANCLPTNLEAFSADRWKVLEIKYGGISMEYTKMDEVIANDRERECSLQL